VPLTEIKGHRGNRGGRVSVRGPGRPSHACNRVGATAQKQGDLQDDPALLTPTTPADNPALYRHLVERLAHVLDLRAQSDPQVSQGSSSRRGGGFRL
jgi:hypothetical protein